MFNQRQIVSYIIALILVGFLLELTNKVSPNAAWTLSVIIILGMLVNNPFILFWLSQQIQTLRRLT